MTLAHTTIGPILPRFLARYPQVSIDMRIANRAVDLVEEGFDLALRVRSTLDDSGSMVVKNFGPSATLLLASPALLERQGRPPSPRGLAQLDTVAMSAQDGRAGWQLVGPGGATFTHVHQPRYVADDLVTLKYAVLEGVGMCALPDYMCRNEIHSGKLVEVLPGWAPRSGIFHAVFPSRRGLVPAVRKFLDYLGDSMAEAGHPY